MAIIEKAGALILEEREDILKTLLVFRGKHQDWSFTKGHIEKGENPSPAAIREVKEETGLDIELLCELPSLKYTLPKGDTALVHMFAGITKNSNLLIREYENDRLEWFSVPEAIRQLTCIHMKEYLSSLSGFLSSLDV